MTRIVVEGVTDREALICAISLVLTSMNVEGAFEVAEHVFLPADHPAATESIGEPEARTTGPVPYVPCPRRRTHRRLTDCWMCWCDVMRGAALEPEVLTPDAWDVRG
jgi:hypothetical protein